MDIFERIVAARHQQQPFVLATVIDIKGSTPRDIGAKMLVFQDGHTEGTIGGGAIEKKVVDACPEVLESNKAQVIHYDLDELQMQCGGNMSVFLEPVVSQPTLLIFGAGHIGQSLARMAAMLNFIVTVVDNRPDFATAERFPTAQQIICKDYKAALPELEFHADAYIVIVTYKHLHDQEILEYCIQQPFRYLGMIGSKTKVTQAFRKLEQAGISQKLIGKVTSPIGLDINAQTPEEICVAILAELVGVRNGADLTSQQMKLDYD